MTIKIQTEYGWGKAIKERNNQFYLEKKERRNREYGNEEMILLLDLEGGAKSHESNKK